MADKKARNLVILVLLVVIPFLFRPVGDMLTGHSTEEVRKKIKKYLRKKYGQEFIVDRIGTRSSDDEEFYQARIYPKSIIGTNKEGDDYYYASATVGKKIFGRLGAVGDSYSYVNRNMDMEKYLLPKAKELFGKRVLLKVDVEHKVTGDGSWWAGYKSKSLKEMRKKVRNDPEHNRIELELDVYIFDRIENKQEKEKRREQIFEFIQYLKEEDLFEYLELGVIFMDERVLAPSYDKFSREVALADKVKKKIDGKTVRLPPMELRERISRKLQQEINEMSEEELLASMQKVQKEDLSYKGINKNNAQASCYIYSPKILNTKYETALKKGILKEKKYSSLSEIVINKEREYIYIN